MNETQTFQKKNEDFGEGFTFLDKLPRSRKLMLLPILCLAFFLDTFNNSSLLPALPAISGRVGLSFSQSAWLLAGYQLTFAALLLIVSSRYDYREGSFTYDVFPWKSGRVTDLYNPSEWNVLFFQHYLIFLLTPYTEWVFTLGSLIVAVFSLVSGFIRSGIPLIVFRAIMGIGVSSSIHLSNYLALSLTLCLSGGALTIPSAQHIIVHLYRDPKEQARAIALFGAMGALGNGA